MFSFTGNYSALASVPAAASIWAANVTNGCIDIFSACTGKLTSSLPPRILLTNAASLTPSRISAELTQANNENVPKPTALQASATHVWVGYDNGNVAIYDHLTHVVVTEGCFHRTPVIAFNFFPDGTAVSGSKDGVLVHWDSESNNFEAITRIKTRDSGAGSLSCLTAAPSCWVVVCGFESGAIHVTDISNGKHSASQRSHNKRITSLAVAGDLLFSSSEDKMINVWRYDATPLPANTYSIAGCGGTHIHSLKLLRRISVHPVVTSLVVDNSTDSLWVSYTDGLIERWSANQDDDFGVEEVVREGILHHSEGEGGQRVIGLYPLSAVETLQVLALASNGINNVWYAHYNTLEEKINKSINTLNSIISQDAVDTASWRGRMDELKKREKARKGRYVYLLESLTRQRLLVRYYESWKRLVVHRTAANPKAKAVLHAVSPRHPNDALMEKVDFLQRRNTFKTYRRFFTLWSNYYDNAQRRKLRLSTAKSLELASQRCLLASIYDRWMMVAMKKREREASRLCVAALERASNCAVLCRFYVKWSKRALSRRRALKARQTFTEDQLQMLESKSQITVLQRALRKWRSASHSLPASEKASGGLHSGSSLARFADLYSKIRMEQMQRCYLSLWRRWAERRRRLVSLRSVADLMQQQCNLLLQQRYYAEWILFINNQRIRKLNEELVIIGDQVHSAETENKDVFEKLQLQKRIEQLHAQKKKDAKEFATEEARIHQIMQETQFLRERLASEPSHRATGMKGMSTALPMSRHTSWYREVLEQQRLQPSILVQMPRDDAVHHIMAQLKGNVLNLYTDISLFRQVREQRCQGAEASSIFMDAFAEIKRLVVPNAPSRGHNRQTGLRWPLFMETLDNIPLHYCNAILTAIKTLAISHDLLSPDGMRGLTAIYDEIIANGDWLFLIFRACQSRRRPVIPVMGRNDGAT